MRYPTDFERWNRDRLDPGFTYPAGESRAEFALRVDRGIQRMLQVIDGTAAPGPSHTMPPDDGVPHERMRHEDGRISSSAVVHEESGTVRGGGVALVVAHRGVIRLIAKRLAGVEPVIELGSIQILQRDRIGDSWRIELIDVLDHLSKLE
jgi:broad specificity phosphatase PhoE